MLTKLLAGSMTDGKMVMVATLSPSLDNAPETASTLRFAEHIKKVGLSAARLFCSCLAMSFWGPCSRRSLRGASLHPPRALCRGGVPSPPIQMLPSFAILCHPLPFFFAPTSPRGTCLRFPCSALDRLGASLPCDPALFCGVGGFRWFVSLAFALPPSSPLIASSLCGGWAAGWCSWRVMCVSPPCRGGGAQVKIKTRINVTVNPLEELLKEKERLEAEHAAMMAQLQAGAVAATPEEVERRRKEKEEAP